MLFKTQKVVCIFWGEGIMKDQKWFTMIHTGVFLLSEAPWSGKPFEVDCDQIKISLENNQHYITNSKYQEPKTTCISWLYQ